MLIGISGKRGVGKTLAASYLQEYYKYKKVSFADALKNHCKQLWGFNQEELAGTCKETPFRSYAWTPRHFMIEFGKFMREFDSNFWMGKVDLTQSKTVIDDVRYPNEVTFIKEHGGKMIRLERFSHLNIYKIPLDDLSETSLDDCKEFDFTITVHNNISKSDLYRQLDKIIGGL